MAGATVPKPTPKNMSVSPGFAGADATPLMAPAGSAKAEKSGNSAATYCPAGRLNAAGASRPGSVALTGRVKGALVPPGVFTTTDCVPVATLDGTWASTCNGLTKSMNADWPPIVAVVPPRAVGAALPLKSALPQV